MPETTVVPLLKKSTNGRLLRGLLRVQFRVLGRVAPATSDRWAARLFSTPRRRGPAPEPSTPGLHAERLRVGSGDVELAVWSWGQGPAVVLAHGWSGNAAQLSSFIRPLLDAGFRVVAFDQPAHGHSTGRRTNLPRMADALQSIARAVGPLHAVVAHSLGATAAALALFDHLPAKQVVLVAPPAAPPYFAQRVASYLGLSQKRTEGMLSQLQREVGIHLDSLDIRSIAGWMRQPALIFHDVQDREVPFAQGRAIAEAWPNARLVPLARLGHIRPLSDAAVVRQAVDFVRQGTAAAGALVSGTGTSA
jgi:pimeloyl-ACP methyl ester carboxylesterase